MPNLLAAPTNQLSIDASNTPRQIPVNVLTCGRPPLPWYSSFYPFSCPALTFVQLADGERFSYSRYSKTVAQPLHDCVATCGNRTVSTTCDTKEQDHDDGCGPVRRYSVANRPPVRLSGE